MKKIVRNVKCDEIKRFDMCLFIDTNNWEEGFNQRKLGIVLEDSYEY